MENDRVYYERRLRQEIHRAEHADAAHQSGLKALHLRWAMLIRERIDKLIKNQ